MYYKFLYYIKVRHHYTNITISLDLFKKNKYFKNQIYN